MFLESEQGGVLSKKDVDRWRKDLRVMSKIYRDIDETPDSSNIAKFNEARGLFCTFRTNFEDWVYNTVLGQWAKDPSNVASESYAEKEVRKLAWSALHEISDLFPRSWDPKSSQSDSPHYVQAPWLLVKNRDKNIKKYNSAFNLAFKALEDLLGEGHKAKILPVEAFDHDGFHIRIEGLTDESPDIYNSAIKSLLAGVSLYKKQVSKVFPKALSMKLPLVLDFNRSTGDSAVGRYNGKTISFYSWIAGNNPKETAKTVAHEFGHHIYKDYLSSSDHKFWAAAARSENHTTLDLSYLLSIWPDKDKYLWSVWHDLRQTDPVLSIQIQVANGYGGLKGVDTKDALKELIAKGSKVTVPKVPITGYSGKSDEEAFCEAFGMLVAYGTRAIHPIVRSWLKAILPSLKTESESNNLIVKELIERVTGGENADSVWKSCLRQP